MMIEIWRRATYEQKLQKVLGIGRSLNEMVRAFLRTRYPDASPRELARRQLARRWFVPIGERQVPVYSAEDIILRKLIWFEQGARVSDRQWRDMLGVVRSSQ